MWLWGDGGGLRCHPGGARCVHYAIESCRVQAACRRTGRTSLRLGPGLGQRRAGRPLARRSSWWGGANRSSREGDQLGALKRVGAATGGTTERPARSSFVGFTPSLNSRRLGWAARRGCGVRARAAPLVGAARNGGVCGLPASRRVMGGAFGLVFARGPRDRAERWVAGGACSLGAGRRPALWPGGLRPATDGRSEGAGRRGEGRSQAAPDRGCGGNDPRNLSRAPASRAGTARGGRGPRAAGCGVCLRAAAQLARAAGRRLRVVRVGPQRAHAPKTSRRGDLAAAPTGRAPLARGPTGTREPRDTGARVRTQILTRWAPTRELRHSTRKGRRPTARHRVFGRGCRPWSR